MTLTTDPLTQTPLLLKERRPLGLTLTLEKQDGSRVDLTGASLRLVIANVPRKGGTVQLTKAGTLISAADGTAQFLVQGSELNFGSGSFDLSITLTSAEGYASTIIEGPVTIAANPDPTVPGAVPSVVSPLSLTAKLRDQNVIAVKVNHHPDSVLLDAASRAETAASAAGIDSSTAEAAASAAFVSAAAAAQAAQNAAGYVSQTNDVNMAAVDANADSDFRQQQDARMGARFARKRALDPRDFGAVGDGVVDDTAAIQAAINAAGDFGAVELPPLAFNITSSLLLKSGTELRGSGMKASRLMVSSDINVIRVVSGQSQIIRNLKIWVTNLPTRTQWQIDALNPTKLVIEDVEIDLPQASSHGGGIRLQRDYGQPGNGFMPQINRLWIRQGTLFIDGCTDGHVSDSYIWASDGALAAIYVKSAPLWTFTAVDVVPADGMGAGYLFDGTEGAQIVGGYNDGSYASNPTGYGLRAVNSRRILVTGHHFYHNGLSAVQLEGSSGCTFTSCGFQMGNKRNGGHADINLVDSDNNTFLANAHAQPTDRTNKGPVYREDAASTNNSIDHAAVDIQVGNFYGTPLFEGNASTQGSNNRPRSLWPRTTFMPSFIAPPAAWLVAQTTPVAWPAANRAYFHRFYVTTPGVYRYARVRVDAASGNMQVAVVRVENGNYTRVMTTGTIAVAAGSVNADMGANYLTAGEYALVVWCDNTTATFPLANGGEPMRTSQMVAEADIAGGVPANGALTWGSSTRAVSGLSLLV